MKGRVSAPSPRWVLITYILTRRAHVSRGGQVKDYTT